MALVGIGVDMLEISRMERVIRRRPSFLRRIFTDDERAYCERCARPAEHYAARFAARNAVLKALDTSYATAGLHDVSVVMDANGRPRAALGGKAAEIAASRDIREIALSISYTRDVAVANAVAVTDDARPQPDPKADAAREMASSFRAARSVLDELDRATEAGELPALEPTDEELSQVAGPQQTSFSFAEEEGEKDAELAVPVVAPAADGTPEPQDSKEL